MKIYKWLMAVGGVLAGLVVGVATLLIFMFLGGAFLVFVSMDRGDLLNGLLWGMGAWVAIAAVAGGFLGYAAGVKMQEKTMFAKSAALLLLIAVPSLAASVATWMYSRLQQLTRVRVSQERRH